MLPAETLWQRVTNPLACDEITIRVRCIRFGTSQDGQRLAFVRLADREVGDLLALTEEALSNRDFWPELGMTFVLRFTHTYGGDLLVLGIGEVSD
jgi:hypothetical protein